MNKQIQSVKDNIDLMIILVSSLVFSGGIAFDKFGLCFLGGVFMVIFYLLYKVKEKEKNEPNETDVFVRMMKQSRSRKVIKIEESPRSYNYNTDRGRRVA